MVISLSLQRAHARVAQLVERDLAKVEAAGSSPVSRSMSGHPMDGRFAMYGECYGTDNS